MLGETADVEGEIEGHCYLSTAGDQGEPLLVPIRTGERGEKPEESREG